MDIANSASEEFSFEKEKAIAKKYAQRFQWEMILIGVGQACIWFSLWPLVINEIIPLWSCLLYTSPSPRDRQKSRMPSSA